MTKVKSSAGNVRDEQNREQVARQWIAEQTALGHDLTPANGKRNVFKHGGIYTAVTPEQRKTLQDYRKEIFLLLRAPVAPQPEPPAPVLDTFAPVAVRSIEHR